MSNEQPTSIWQRLQAPALLVRGSAAVVALTIALALTSCGGEGDSDDDSGGPTPTATASTTSTPTPTPSGPLPEVTDVAPELDFFGALAVVNSHPITATFDSAADSLSLADGASIEVPAGGFPVATDMSVAIIDLLFENYLTNPPEARIYVLSTEDDIVLGAPLVLEVPKPADSVNVTRLVDGEWLPVDVPVGATTRIEITHFSDNLIAVADKPSGDTEPKPDLDETSGGVAATLLVLCITAYGDIYDEDVDGLAVKFAVSACTKALVNLLTPEGEKVDVACVGDKIGDETTIHQAIDKCLAEQNHGQEPSPSPEPDPQPEPEACPDGSGASQALAQDPCPEPSEPPEDEPADPEGFLTLQDLSAVLDDCKERSSGNLQCFYTLGATLQYETSGLPSSISCDFGSLANSERVDLSEVSGTVALTEGYIETLVGGTVFQDGNPIVVKCRLLDNSAPDGDSFTVARIEEELTLPLP